MTDEVTPDDALGLTADELFRLMADNIRTRDTAQSELRITRAMRQHKRDQRDRSISNIAVIEAEIRKRLTSP